MQQEGHNLFSINKAAIIIISHLAHVVAYQVGIAATIRIIKGISQTHQLHAPQFLQIPIADFFVFFTILPPFC